MKLILSFTLCVLLPLTQVFADDASPDQTQDTAEAVSGHEDLSRAKRALDYRRLARGIQMLRLGKRQLPLLRLGKREHTEDDLLLQNLLSSLGSPYYDDDYLTAEEPLHARYRRSADPSQETMPAGTLLADSAQDSSSSSSAVKRSVNDLDDHSDFEDSYLGDEDSAMVKRPMGMLRLGKRPVGMLRLGKRPVGMLRLGKRLTDLDSSDEEFEDSEDVFDPDMNEEEDLSVENSPDAMLPQSESDMPVSQLEKRPVGMLRLGKRPVGMLRLGKRPVGMLRLGKRPVGMLRLGKRQLPLLRLGKRAAE